MAPVNDREEQFILRVQDRALAARIRTLLRSGSPAELDSVNMQLKFSAEGQGRSGHLVFQGEEYPFSLLDLPTILESYKTYNDIDLVKSSDIGQVFLVREQGSTAPQEGTEYRHGITPPMRDVRKRMFRPADLPSPAVMKQLAQQLLTISGGQAPEGMEFVDVEEEYQVDEEGNGAWKPLPPVEGGNVKPAAPTRKYTKRAKKKEGPGA